MTDETGEETTRRWAPPLPRSPVLPIVAAERGISLAPLLSRRRTRPIAARALAGAEW